MTTKGRELYGREWNRLRQKVYSGARWKRTRRAALDRAGWRCEACGRAGRLEVHHRRRVSEHPNDGDAWYDLGNLHVLCRPCHFARHRGENREAGRANMRQDRREWRARIDRITDKGREDGNRNRNPE